MRRVPLLSSLFLVSATLYSDNHFSVLAEFVYMQRSDLHGKSVVEVIRPECTCPTVELINTRDLMHRFHYEPGFRVGVGYMINPKHSVEASYLWVEDWNAHKKVEDPGELFFPFNNSSYTQDYVDADKANAKYCSHFSNAELNYWRHWTPRKADYWSVSGIFGFRYIHLKENFNLEFEKGADKSHYDIHTYNHLYTPQLGLGIQYNPTEHLSWDVNIKVGVIINDAVQKTFLGDQNDTVVLRDFKRHKIQGGFLGDVAAAVGYQVWSHMDLHVGYQMIYMYGLALAPEQVKKKTDPDEVKILFTKGNAIVHGLFAGMTFNF